MTLELASVPLAAAAGALGVLSPCVWPLVPVVNRCCGAEAVGQHRRDVGVVPEWALAF